MRVSWYHTYYKCKYDRYIYTPIHLQKILTFVWKYIQSTYQNKTLSLINSSPAGNTGLEIDISITHVPSLHGNQEVI